MNRYSSSQRVMSEVAKDFWKTYFRSGWNFVNTQISGRKRIFSRPLAGPKLKRGRGRIMCPVHVIKTAHNLVGNLFIKKTWTLIWTLNRLHIQVCQLYTFTFKNGMRHCVRKFRAWWAGNLADLANFRMLDSVE